MIREVGVLLVVALFAVPMALAQQKEEIPIETQDLEGATQSILTADPQTILKARKLIIDGAAARRTPIPDTYDDIAESVIDIEEVFNITGDPDTRTPVINIARYMSTSVNFVDAYGKPWPIRKIVSFLDGLVEIEKAAEAEASAEDGANTIDINDPQAGSVNFTALKHGVAGNVTVYLMKRSAPITLSLEGKSAVYHKEATIKVLEVGPQTDIKKLNRGDEVVVGTKTDADLNNALYGIGPPGSQRMEVEGGEGKAWLKGNILYLQTPLSVFTPKVIGTAHASGRYRAYKTAASPMVMATNDEGKTVKLLIKRSAASEVFSEAMSGGGH